MVKRRRNKRNHRYINKNGYEEKRTYSPLIHRQNAYKYIYLKNRDKYPLPFSKYVVHHKDGNKRHNHSSNLMILTQEEHERIHGFGRGDDDYKVIIISEILNKIVRIGFFFGGLLFLLGIFTFLKAESFAIFVFFFAIGLFAFSIICWILNFFLLFFVDLWITIVLHYYDFRILLKKLFK